MISRRPGFPQAGEIVEVERLPEPVIRTTADGVTEGQTGVGNRDYHQLEGTQS